MARAGAPPPLPSSSSSSAHAAAAAASSSSFKKKEKAREDGLPENTDELQSKRLRDLSFSNGLLSRTRSRARHSLPASKSKIPLLSSSRSSSRWNLTRYAPISFGLFLQLEAGLLIICMFPETGKLFFFFFFFCFSSLESHGLHLSQVLIVRTEMEIRSKLKIFFFSAYFELLHIDYFFPSMEEIHHLFRHLNNCR
jgi:hypothetical protein